MGTDGALPLGGDCSTPAKAKCHDESDFLIQPVSPKHFSYLALLAVKPLLPSSPGFRFVGYLRFVVPISKESTVSFFYRKGAKVAKGRKALVDEAMMMNLIF